MTQDEIIELAIENTINGLTFNQDGLVRFAKLVAQHEREACAKLAELAEPYQTADLIRKRGQA